MRNALHSSSTTRRQPGLAERAESLVKTVNKLIADIEADVAAPQGALFHARGALDELALAHNALLAAIPDQALNHYQAMAAQAGAVQAAGGVA
ncbi:MAG: hypothetical protein GAK28_03195 [Luteibacter sp.]|uniref:hypothetical protein n=1 Tax=Luteibacter sp. TaxID=1886636 RepID=UPI00137DA1D9|nr:hypothetical protein [Luteibacter sp.]KAF1005443.1 MAG: hypothetical protein GAK28_03195 [Luteibacter sp.]